MTKGDKKMLKIFSGLGSLFLCLLIALGFKIYFAVKTHQPVMKQDYYDTGRLYDQYVKNNANTSNRMLKSEIFKGASHTQIPLKNKLKRTNNNIHVQYTNTNSKGVENAKIMMSLSRRSTNNQDIRSICVTDNKGTCSISIQRLGQGYWETTLSASDPKGRFSLRGSFFVD